MAKTKSGQVYLPQNPPKSDEHREHLRSIASKGGYATAGIASPRAVRQSVMELIQGTLQVEYPDIFTEDKPSYNPVLELARLSVDPKTPIIHRVACLKEVAQFFMPKLKAMEITGPDGGPIQVVNADSLSDAVLARIIQGELADD